MFHVLKAALFVQAFASCMSMTQLVHSQKCASEGARVIATDVNAEKLQELKREQPAIVTDNLDVTRREDVEHLLRVKYSDVNVLFNCAG